MLNVPYGEEILAGLIAMLVVFLISIYKCICGLGPVQRKVVLIRITLSMIFIFTAGFLYIYLGSSLVVFILLLVVLFFIVITLPRCAHS